MNMYNGRFLAENAGGRGGLADTHDELILTLNRHKYIVKT
jgi:hypothetical protein